MANAAPARDANDDESGVPAAAAGEPFASGEFDFETILAAVMETARGRWFLDEHARRVRAAELERIETSLARIERRLGPSPGPVREAETRIVALSVHQRLIDLAAALRASGVGEDACGRIEAQAQALLDLARRRNLMGAQDAPEPASEPAPERARPGPRAAPAA